MLVCSPDVSLLSGKLLNEQGDGWKMATEICSAGKGEGNLQGPAFRLRWSGCPDILSRDEMGSQAKLEASQRTDVGNAMPEREPGRGTRTWQPHAEGDVYALHSCSGVLRKSLLGDTSNATLHVFIGHF